LQLPVQGLGCMGLSFGYHSAKEFTDDEKIAFIRKVIDLGVNHLDTSDFYGPHTNEILIGKALQGIPREKYILATKFAGGVQDGKFFIRGDRPYVRKCCEDSLKRLGLDYIDLYYVHRIDQTVPIEDTMDELVLLLKEGKIKHIGLSEPSPDTVRRAHAVYPITAVQLEWSLWTRDVEEDLIPVLRELGIGIVAYSPLGRGFLTGSIQKPSDLAEGDWRAGNPRFKPESLDQNAKLLDALNHIAQAKGVTTGQIALAWVQQQGDDVVTIPGTSKEKHLLDNLASVFVKLTPEELKTIGNAIPVDKVAGDRYEGLRGTYKYDKNPLRPSK